MKRRNFLKTTAAVTGAALVPYYFSPQQALARTESANDRLGVGVIGNGGIANANMNAAKDWLDVVAVADVDQGRREGFSQKFSNGKAQMFNDYRKVIEHPDVDVIHVATPDHWHTKPVIESMLAGKDVYCEKPLTLTIEEGQRIREVQRKTGRVVQVGTQQRSTFQKFVKAMAIVQQGRIGKIQRMEVAIGGSPVSPEIPVADVPSGFDWDRWLGPAPKVDFRQLIIPGDGKKKRPKKHTNGHYEFRWWYEYSGGKLTDWGAHHVDIAMWALRVANQNDALISVSGTAEHPVDMKDGMPVQTDRYNTATKFKLTCKFPGDVEMLITNEGNGVLIQGDKGRIYVNRGRLSGKPVEDLADNPLPDGSLAQVYKGLPMLNNERKGHWANFVHCVKNRLDPISDVHSHMRMLNVCHLASICGRLGRTIKWDDANEKIVGDDVAASMLSRPYREGYEIEMG